MHNQKLLELGGRVLRFLVHNQTTRRLAVATIEHWHEDKNFPGSTREMLEIHADVREHLPGYEAVLRVAAELYDEMFGNHPGESITDLPDSFIVVMPDEKEEEPEE